MSDYGDLAYQIALENQNGINMILGKIEIYEERIDRLQQQLFTACVILNAQADALIEQAHAIIALEESDKNLD